MVLTMFAAANAMASPPRISNSVCHCISLKAAAMPPRYERHCARWNLDADKQVQKVLEERRNAHGYLLSSRVKDVICALRVVRCVVGAAARVLACATAAVTRWTYPLPKPATGEPVLYRE
jgi:hypothetical protein